MLKIIVYLFFLAIAGCCPKPEIYPEPTEEFVKKDSHILRLQREAEELSDENHKLRMNRD